MPFIQVTKKLLISSVAALSLFATGNTNAGLLNISDIPLDVIEGVPANIILTMDDSGSMSWSYMPDDIDGLRDTNRGFSSTVNRIYYNPQQSYTPATDKFGTSLGDSPYTNAWINGFNQGGTKTNLSTSFRPTWGNNNYRGTAQTAYYYRFDTATCNITLAADLGNDACYNKVVVSATSGLNYDPVTTTCTAPVDRTNTSCFTTGFDERQNFANWYSYYRIRHLVAKTAATKAFSGLSDTIRVSWNTLNDDNVPGDTLPFSGTHRTNFFNWLNTVPTSGRTPLRRAIEQAGIKYSSTGLGSPYAKNPGSPVSATNPEYSCRQNFLFAFTDGRWNGGDPAIGNKDDSLFDLPNGPKYGVKTYTPTNNLTANTTPPIYRGETESRYLADIALHYWGTDLRDGANALDNDVPVYEPDTTTDYDKDGAVTANDLFWNPKNDPAQWQHMVSFFIGMGVDGNLDFNGTTTSGTTYDQLTLGTGGGGLTWGGDQYDDMWHAAINGRGEYFSASRPDELVTSFQAVLGNLDGRTASSSAIATDSSELFGGGVLFQAKYDPSKWTGDIVAYDASLILGNIATSTAASLNIALKWSASNKLDLQAAGGTGREILTYDPTTGKGIPFQWASLKLAQKTLLDTLGGTDDGLGADRLDYLRGDQSKEKTNAGPFRNRTTLFGDFVNASPQFITQPGPPVTIYPDNLESVAYSEFVTNKAGRTDMIIAGANDGMLHILNAETGNEIMGYVPSTVYRNLSELTNPSYVHKFFVDHTIRVEDVFYSGNWHTVAIGGLGKGGQGIYALDITDPTLLKEANAAGTVLWEFTDSDDADLGYSYTEPQIFKMNNGKWMVGFNNGYNSNEDDTAIGGQQSATGNGIMYFIDLATGGKGPGGDIIKLDTKIGLVDDPTGAGRANRLTDFVALDVDKNYTIDYLYAGDLFGNVWKFDVTSTNSNSWKVFGSGATPKPLFVATDPAGNRQPITQNLKVIKHRTKNGYLIYFGTGKFLEAGDRTDTQIQTVYSFWDREESPSVTTIQRQHLLQQWVDFETTVTDTDTTTVRTVRTSTLNATKKEYNRYVIDWYLGSGTPTTASKTYLGWHMDLGVTGSLTNSTITTPDGEKIDNHLFLESIGDGVIEFATLIPNDNPCDKGGDSVIYRLNTYTGNRGEHFQFLNGTTLFATNSNGDLVPISASKRPKRIKRTKTWHTPPGECLEVNIDNASDGSFGVATNKCNNKGLGRRSWRQIHIE
jgi:type IV pilus assembly protein PilY1